MGMSRTAQLDTHVLGSMGTFVRMSNGSLLSRSAGGGGRLKGIWFHEGRGSGQVLVNREKEGLILILSLGTSGRERFFLGCTYLRGWMLGLWVWKADSRGAACMFFQEPRRGPMKTMWGKFFLAADPQLTASRLPPSPAWTWALATPSAPSSPCSSPHRADPASSLPGHAWPGTMLSCPRRLQAGTLGSSCLSSQDRGSPSSDSLCSLRPHSQPFVLHPFLSTYCVPGPGLGSLPAWSSQKSQSVALRKQKNNHPAVSQSFPDALLVSQMLSPPIYPLALLCASSWARCCHAKYA